MLYFTSGPATITNPSHIHYFDQPAGVINGVKVIQQSKDHIIYLTGEFGNFRIYFLVTHTRVEIVPKSVVRLSVDKFAARLKLELSSQKITEHLVVFNSPIDHYSAIRETSYGLFPDSFEFCSVGLGKKAFPCDLSFLLLHAENCPKIPLRVEYIGIAKAEKREAQDRLGEGHEKLQTLLAAQNLRQSRQTTSIVLYRPSKLDTPIFSFPDVIETIEATMIQYFKPQPLNIERLNFPHDSPELCRKIKLTGARSIFTEVTAPKGTTLFSDSTQQLETHQIRVNLR